MRTRSFWAPAILCGLAAITSSARADIFVTVTVTDGSMTVASTPRTLLVAGSPTDNGGLGIQSTAFNGTFGGLVVQNGSAGESQDATASQAFSTALNIRNTSGALRVITILLEATNFTAPIPQAAIQSSFGGTATGVTGSFRSSVGTLGTNTPGFQSPTLVPSFNHTAFGTASGLSAPFTIFQELTFTFTSASTSRVNFAAITTLTPVPEPATVAMLATSVPLVAVGAVVRRRRKARA